MCENVNPKVIVDDDFLDLRNVHGKAFSRRPISPHSIAKGSSSINTQGKSSTVKEVLPGLQRFLNNYNKKKSNSFGYKNNNLVHPQPVDCRFRRKIENKTLSSRSESILQENGESRRETVSTELSSRNHSSESGERDKLQGQTELPEIAPKEKKCLTTRIENETVFPFEAKEENNPFINVRRQESNEKLKIVKNQCKKKSEILMNYVQCDVRENTEIERNAFERSINPTSRNTCKHYRFDWKNSKLESSCGLHSIPTFKKSWTVPSLPLIKNTFSWTKHYNALCAKVDRKTYEFDTDDTISDSEDQLSTYSSISRSNYINLIFCLGCLCGIFLIGSILTASEIHADYFKPIEPEGGMFANFCSKISSTLRLILRVFQQILTLPSTKLFRTTVESTSHWRFLTKYVYFIPE